MSDREPLRPCPLCGPNVESWNRVREYIKNDAFHIRCPKCGITLTRKLVPMGEWERVAPMARKFWNTRQPHE
jgi:uncharacterized Zn finger protein